MRDRLSHEVVDPVPTPVGRNDRSFSPGEVNAAPGDPLGALARVVQPPRQMSSTAPSSSSATVTGPMTSSI
jgi:hypothetical protein